MGRSIGETESSQALSSGRTAITNGVSETEELQSLSNSVIRVIELRYRESRRHDENSYWFQYRAKVKDERGAQVRTLGLGCVLAEGALNTC